MIRGIRAIIGERNASQAPVGIGVGDGEVAVAVGV
jgi:hypothetical protein